MPISEPSRTDREFLKHLAFRQAHPASEPCWITAEPLGRWRLIVFTMMGWYAASPFVKNVNTLARLEAVGYIKRGPQAQLPQPFASSPGHKLVLMPAGYAVINSTPPEYLQPTNTDPNS